MHKWRQICEPIDGIHVIHIFIAFQRVLPDQIENHIVKILFLASTTYSSSYFNSMRYNHGYEPFTVSGRFVSRTQYFLELLENRRSSTQQNDYSVTYYNSEFVVPCTWCLVCTGALLCWTFELFAKLALLAVYVIVARFKQI